MRLVEARTYRTTLPLAALLLLAACAPAPKIMIHDLYVYGEEDARFTYFYGDAAEFRYENGTVTLTQQPENEPGEGAVHSEDAPYSMPGASLVNGAPYLKEPIPPLEAPAVTARRIPLTTDLVLRSNVDTDQVVYFDGTAFLLLLERAEAGTELRVVPRPLISGLRGLGELSRSEAAALERTIREDGQSAVIAFLKRDSLPAHPVDRLEEHRRTGIYVQSNIEIDEAAFRPTPEALLWEVAARGSQAVGFGSRTFELIRNEEQLLSLWNRAHAASLTVPRAPRPDFRRETLLGVFMGSQPTGGYGVSVERVTEERGELYVDLRFMTPQPGDITTQAVTSPWLFLRVQRGGYEVVWLRDADKGDLIGAARATN